MSKLFSRLYPGAKNCQCKYEREIRWIKMHNPRKPKKSVKIHTLIQLKEGEKMEYNQTRVHFYLANKISINHKRNENRSLCSIFLLHWLRISRSFRNSPYKYEIRWK